ncbi:MAG TPA: phenylalanine--tRNA ligase subunit beta [Vicinamibacterales bacterium]
MRLLISWVRDFVDVKASPQEIAETLGLRGFEVAAIEPMDDGDAVIDFEVTANRPDCLSVVGFAREIGTAFNLPAAVPPDPGSRARVVPLAFGESDRLKVTLEDAELCPRYAAAVAEVTPTATPAWMTKRLLAAGVRPISPIVDVTNYVLMELGQPMHAFDLATLAGSELRIRRAASGERITTLDGIERTLEPDALVIADARRAQAVAGVMGGGLSEVSGATRTIAFESAYFNPVSVRRTSKRLGLKTEASSRFERGGDVNAPVVALQRAVALMQNIGAGRLIGSAIDRYPKPRRPRELTLRRQRLTSLLGLRVPDGDVVRILRGLGLSVIDAREGWAVTVPTFRVDLLREVDLIEEVGRHYGFDKLDAKFPVMTAAAPPPDPRIGRDREVRRVLTGAGLSEAVTFGFIEAKAAAAFADGDGDALIAVANPLSAKFDMLRPSLLPGLVTVVAHNRRHGRRDVGLFELGARYTRSAGERRAAAFAWTGAGQPEHWSGGAREVDFFDAKGIVELLCGALGVDARFEPARLPYLVDGQAARVSANGSAIGIIGRLTPAIADERGAPKADAIFVGELDLEALDAGRAARTEWVQPLPRHPFVVRDLSIVVPDALPAEIIRGTIQTAGAATPAPLTAVSFFDRYKGKGVPEGSTSVSVRLTFQAPDRTLTDAEVQQSFDRILDALVREHGAIQR